MHNKLIELLKEQMLSGNFDLLERVIHGQSFRPLLMSLPEEVKILLYNDFVGEDVFTVCLKDSDYPEGQEADQEMQFLDFMEAMAAFTVEVDCLNEGQKVQLIKSTILSGNPFHGWESLEGSEKVLREESKGFIEKTKAQKFQEAHEAPTAFLYDK